jgi:hypothetical protein
VAGFPRPNTAPSAFPGDERVDVVGQPLATLNTALLREPCEPQERRDAVMDHIATESVLAKPLEIPLDVGGEPATSDAADFPGEEQLLQHEDLLGRWKMRRGILDGVPLCGHPRRPAWLKRRFDRTRQQNGGGNRTGIMSRGT